MACRIEVRRVLGIVNPIITPPWSCGCKLRPRHVWAALNCGRFQTEPVPWANDNDHEMHAARIAHLIINGWDDPIFIDVGIPSMGCHPVWPVVDGNHRLYAAIFMGYPAVMLEVDGDVAHAAELFGVRESDITEEF